MQSCTPILALGFSFLLQLVHFDANPEDCLDWHTVTVCRAVNRTYMYPRRLSFEEVVHVKCVSRNNTNTGHLFTEHSETHDDTQRPLETALWQSCNNGCMLMSIWHFAFPSYQSMGRFRPLFYGLHRVPICEMWITNCPRNQVLSLILCFQLQQSVGTEGTAGAEASSPVADSWQWTAGKMALRATDGRTHSRSEEAQNRGACIVTEILFLIRSKDFYFIYFIFLQRKVFRTSIFFLGP